MIEHRWREQNRFCTDRLDAIQQLPHSLLIDREVVGIEFRVPSIVHTKVQGHIVRLVRRDIIFKAGQGIRGGIPADARIAKPDASFRILRIETLVRNGVSEKNDRLPVLWIEG